ncbi:HNH endonuclease [Candidatus Saccharibacteria bacterium]|nr:HNH endonuclease [Candidatus Saccharibacteria bacterium]
MERRRRLFIVIVLALMPLAGAVYESFQQNSGIQQVTQNDEDSSRLASDVLNELQVKGRAPKTGYARSEFGNGWVELNGCDTRNRILNRDLTEKVVNNDGCKVLSGILDDPYTKKVISFTRGEQSSQEVQIDHVVALSDSWQKGAQYLEEPVRIKIANDPLNLSAVDGEANQEKGDSDAASWLPPNKDYRCRYVARQIAVKAKYNLWVTKAESDSMKRILTTCPDQRLPIEK